MPKPVILASGSKTRAMLLQNAGVPIEQIAPNIDETSVKQSMIFEGAPPDKIAGTLAEMKALKIANKQPERLILGSDQVLCCEDQLLDKPHNLEEAKTQLKFLRGKKHQLITLAVIVEHSQPVWSHMSRATLQMRDFSDTFLDTYIDQHGSGLTETVGSYKLEQGGAQLFSRVEGDYFSILGLPLLEVLGFLRTRGTVPE